MSDVFERFDSAMKQLAQARDALLADPGAPDRAARLAALFETEARAWSTTYRLSGWSLFWQAVSAAEALAWANAARWTQRAQQEQAGGASAQSWAAGRVGSPRPVALTTTTNGR